MDLQTFELLPASARLSLRRYGQRTRLQTTDATLAAATAAPIIGNNPDRVSLLVVNTGQANPFTITGDATLGVAAGDPIGANGGSYALDAIEDGEAVGRAVFGISTGGTTVHIEEVIAYGPVVQLPQGIGVL